MIIGHLPASFLLTRFGPSIWNFIFHWTILLELGLLIWALGYIMLGQGYLKHQTAKNL